MIPWQGRPDRIEIFLRTAEQFARLGTCRKAQVGCVITRENRIVVTGYNGAPAGLEHCDDPRGRVIVRGDGEIIADVTTRDDVPQSPGDTYATSETCPVCVHAEANAIAYAARAGAKVEGGALHCTHMPCLNCAKLIVNAGIKLVSYITPYRDKRGAQLLHDAGVDVTEWPLNDHISIGDYFSSIELDDITQEPLLKLVTNSGSKFTVTMAGAVLF